jgi:hypothetical protein
MAQRGDRKVEGLRELQLRHAEALSKYPDARQPAHAGQFITAPSRQYRIPVVAASMRRLLFGAFKVVSRSTLVAGNGGWVWVWVRRQAGCWAAPQESDRAIAWR